MLTKTVAIQHLFMEDYMIGILLFLPARQGGTYQLMQNGDSWKCSWA